MIGKSFTLLLLLSVFSSIYSENATKVLNAMCQTQSKAIKAGTFEKLWKEREDCREQSLPKDIYAAVNKCQEILPMMTADQVTKVCSDKEASAAKMSELLECEKKALGSEYMPKFAECCKKMDPDNAKKSNK